MFVVVSCAVILVVFECSTCSHHVLSAVRGKKRATSEAKPDKRGGVTQRGDREGDKDSGKRKDSAAQSERDEKHTPRGSNGSRTSNNSPSNASTHALALTEADISEDTITINNLTIINCVIRAIGPTSEAKLTSYMLLLQTLCSVFAFAIRYWLARAVYDRVE